MVWDISQGNFSLPMSVKHNRENIYMSRKQLWGGTEYESRFIAT